MPHVSGSGRAPKKKQSIHTPFKIAVATGLGTVLVVGIAVGVWYMAAHDHQKPSLAISTIRPVETIRFAKPDDTMGKKAKGPSPTHDVPQPQGTLRRMDGISSAFSKK